MKKNLSIIVLIVSTVAAFGGTPKNFSVNNSVGQNSVTFISDAPMEKIVGTAENGLTGAFTMDINHPEETRGKIVVEVRSMKTAITRRDESMYGTQWLDANKYPNIVYEIASMKDVKVNKSGGKTTVTATAVGTFTCHGVTKPLTAQLEITYLAESAETKKRASGDLVLVTAKFDVALKDYEIKGKSGLVGSSVGEVINVTVNLYANAIGS